MELHQNLDEWYLALQDARVQMIQVDFRLGLLLGDDTGTAQLHVETPFKFQLPEGGWVQIAPENPETMSPILSLANQPLSEVRAGKDGSISLEFFGGRKMLVPPDDQFEAWQLSCGKKSLVSGPQGSIAYFQQ